MKDYGDKYGPTVEWFLRRGKSYEDMIRSSQTPSGPLKFFADFMRGTRG